ncbi:putative uncharacterized protein [Moritella viscosa]|nr:putative uncharacterized protein [Moritella viscosa]
MMSSIHPVKLWIGAVFSYFKLSWQYSILTLVLTILLVCRVAFYLLWLPAIFVKRLSMILCRILPSIALT